MDHLTPAPVNPAWLLPGTRVGGYVVRRALGRGGGQMAYLAEGPRKRPAVLKVSLFPRGERGSEARVMHQRFLRQIAFFLQLDDVPGIARVSAHGTYPDTSRTGHLYLVQEWVPKSRTVIDWSSEAPRPLNIIVCGWVMLAAACSEMARRGICHRDLKAENVLMTPRGVPKIVDFNSGIGPGAERFTGSSARHVPGPPSSYSPEHCEAILEERAARRQTPFQYLPTGDLHALGVIFYEVLTGEHPFSHARGEELYESIAHQMPERPRELNPDVPFGLEKVTMKLLQKKPEQRYQSGDEVAADLEALFSTGEDWNRLFRTPGRPATPRTRTPPTPAMGASALVTPSAIVRAGPRSIVVRSPLALALPPEPEVQAKARPRRRLVPALLAFLVASWFLGRPFAAPTPDVRAEDQDWLAHCPPEARRAVQELQLQPDHGLALLQDGPNVITHDKGCEVRAGPVEVAATIMASPRGLAPVLLGEIRTGSDGASFRFTKLRLDDGRELPICATASAWGSGDDDPGVPKAEPGGESPPGLHPDFTLITTGALELRFAR